MHDVRVCTDRLIRAVLIVTGTILVILGITGIFLPLLPTTPFLLAAAACYAASSGKFYLWLINNRLLGGYIKNYREKKGMTLRSKAISVVSLWLGIGYSMAFFTESLPVRAILLVIALGVSIHLLCLKTIAGR